MEPDSNFLAEIDRSVRAGIEWNDALARILTEFAGDSGTIHLLGDDGVLHLRAASAGIPQVVSTPSRMFPSARAWPVSPSSAGSPSTRAIFRRMRVATSGPARAPPACRVRSSYRFFGATTPLARLAWRIAANGRSRTRRPSGCWTSAACWRARHQRHRSPNTVIGRPGARSFLTYDDSQCVNT